MTTKHTPGNWTLGKTGGTVVSDQPLPNYTARGGHDETRYYGGHLIAESIWREEDARLIAGAPVLLEALEASVDALNWVIEQGGGPACEHEAGVCFCKENNALNAARAAIAKARGAQ